MITAKKAVRFTASILVATTVLLTSAMASGRPALVTADALRLRTEPSVTSPVLTMLYKDNEVSVLSEDQNGWYEVLYRDQQGYASSQYLAFSTEALLAYVNTGADMLNVRSGPGTTYEILGKANGGTTLTVISSGDTWHEVVFEGGSGFVTAEYTRLMSQSEYDSILANSSTKGSEVAAFAQNYLGCNYVYGGNGPSSFDCSGFVKYIYGQFGYTLNRTASDQLKNGISIEKSELQAGDLVFFNNGRTSKPVSHVGLYIGNGDFIHASTESKGVRIDNLDSGHYAGVYVYARRIV